jgi:hypothetical protein
MTSPVTGTFTSAAADECAVFAFVLEGPISEQVVVLPGIASRLELGALQVGTAGPAQTVVLPSIVSTVRLGRFTVTNAPAPLTIQLRGIPPR